LPVFGLSELFGTTVTLQAMSQKRSRSSGWRNRHESSRTTGLYDRRGDSIELDEIEKILY
jgi:ribosomal protein L34